MTSGLPASFTSLRATFVVAAGLHVPLLLGFIVITEARLREADTVSAT